MGATTQVTAVELGATAIRVVELEGAGSEARVARRGAASLPPNAWNDLAANREAFVAAIQSAMASAGSAARAVVACLPRRLVTLRVAQLPAGSPEQMRGMVTFEAQQYIPFALDEVVLDYQLLSEPLSGFASGEGDNLETVLIAAARRSLIADLLAIFDRAGLELLRLSVSALALAENARDALEPTALIALEPGAMDVVVVANGRLLFTRATSLSTAGRSEETARARIVEEAVRSFTAYQNEFRASPLAHVHLAGASAAGTEGETLQRALSEVLEMPVTRLESRLLPPGDPELQSYVTAIGLARQGADGRHLVNLVPDERAARRAQEARRRAQIMAGVAAAVVVIAAVVWTSVSLRAQRRLRAEAVTANAKLNEVNSQLEARQRNHDRLAALDAAVSAGLDRQHPVVDVLAAVNMALPKSAVIWLTQFEFERGGLLTLHGNTRSASAATDLVLSLQQSGAFTDVRLGYLGDAQEDRAPTPQASGTAAPSAETPPSTSTAPPSSTPAVPSGLPAMPGGPAPSSGPTSAPAPGGPPTGTPGSAPPGGISPGGPPPGSPPPGASPSATPAPGGVPGGVQFQGDRVVPGPGRIRVRPIGFQTIGPRTSVRPGANAATPRRAAPARPNAAQKAKTGGKAALTSFVITCRLNPDAPDLLPRVAAPRQETTAAVSYTTRPVF
jgi:Tfp pilus assembly PilM family ATPase/Tfp pilus assembly protein PilN